MKFKIDENLPVDVAQLLRTYGHDAVTVLDQALGGEADADIAQICQREKRVIVTIDLGFADIRTYPPKEYAGLIVLRLQQQDKFSVMQVLQRLAPLLEMEQLHQKLWIVEQNRVRIRA
ncbi:MAG: DUF5615 family PIN-like protein [Anaerolineales bacterium]|nr:DUF5615 family PIN-like protein [Anaerolineales bacterium]MCA9973612.1 DUF5615 family PIN-like protein [Anaerolineales bacterium]